MLKTREALVRLAELIHVYVDMEGGGGAHVRDLIQELKEGVEEGDARGALAKAEKERDEARSLIAELWQELDRSRIGHGIGVTSLETAKISRGSLKSIWRWLSRRLRDFS